MGVTIPIIREPYDKGTKIFGKSEITVEPGVTVLVGCNGAGKTTMLRQIEKYLESVGAKYMKFDNHVDGDRNAMERYMYHGVVDMFATMTFSSEGERIMTVLGEQATYVGRLARTNRGKDIFILMDAVDSGFSIDNVDELKEYLFKTVIEDHTASGGNVYIIVTANSYEMARGEDCIDVIRCAHVRFKGYESYRRCILTSKKKKERRA